MCKNYSRIFLNKSVREKENIKAVSSVALSDPTAPWK